MTTKLTLSMDSKVIESDKKYLGPLPAEFDYKKEVRDRVYEKHVKR